MRKTINKIPILLFTVFFALFSTLSFYSDVFAAEDAPTINVGKNGIAVKIKYDKVAEEGTQTVTENLVSNSNGIVTLTNLYNYCKDLNWDDHDYEYTGPIVSTITIEYEVNYPGKTPAQKDNEANGNGRYTDAQGSYTIRSDEDWQAEKRITISDVKFVEGTAVYKNSSGSTTPCETNKSVKVRDKTIAVTNNGKFSGYPDMLEADYEDSEIFIEGNDDYDNYRDSYANFKKTHIAELPERNSPSQSDYTYGENISDNGYVAAAGEYTINGTNGSTLALSKNGPFSQSVKVTIDNNGNVQKVYVKKSNEIITKPVKNIIRLDQAVPIIDGIDVVRETSGDLINFFQYGIFTKTFADLTIEMRVTDIGSGVDHIYMEGTDKTTGEKITYKPVSMKKNNNSYNLAFEIEGDDFKILEKVLRVLAVDKVGNISELRLVRASEAASTLMMESVKPTITNIVTEGNKSEHDWYNSPVNIKYDAQDKDSGLYNLRINLNGKEEYVKEFTTSKNINVNSLNFNISKELVESHINADGSYTAFFILTDNSGNVTTLEKKYYIDLVSPNITLSGIEDGSNYNSTPTLNVENDEKHYDVKGAYTYLKVLRNGSKYYEKKYEQQNAIEFSGFEHDGRYEVTVYAMDAAGNKSEVKKVNFIKDTEKPDLKITNISGKKKNGWYSSAVKVEFTVHDPLSGLADVSADVNDKEKFSKSFAEGNTKNNNYSLTISKNDIEKLINDAGSYEISIKAEDQAGNVAKLKKKLRIDIVKPVVNLSGIQSGKHYISPPALNIKNNEKHYNENGAFIHVKVTKDGKVVNSKKYGKRKELNYSSYPGDGNYNIQVYAEDAAGNRSTIKSVSFVKDSTKPKITINGVKNSAIYNTKKTVVVSVDERYFKTNKVKVSVIRKLDGKTETISFPWSNTGKKTVHSKTLSKTGIYTVKATAVDEAGNKAESKTVSFTIDTEKPKITISNIANRAYGKKAVVAPVIKIYDDFYKSKTITLYKNGKTTNSLPYSFSGSLKGGKAVYKDFEKKEKNDGVYRLFVKVTDKAGNSSSKAVNFSVNRFGSTFVYNDVLRRIIAEKYIQDVPKDLKITEYNVSKVTSSEDDIKRDGTPSYIKAKKSRDKAENYYTYIHSYKAFDFNQEGVYSINIMSKDVLNNIAESKKKTGKINFTVDRTAPNVTLDKEIDNEAFDADIINVKAQIVDSLSPASVKVYVNDNEVVNKKFNKNSGEVNFNIPEGRNNDVKIITKDLAGNDKTFTYRGVTVSTNWFTRLTGNYLFYAGIVVFLLAAAASGYLVYRKKKTAA